MVKVNGEDVEWEKAPNFVNNIKRKVLWKDQKTGAIFAILKIPKGVLVEDPPHSHPHSNQFTFVLSGELESSNGTHSLFSEGDYSFNYHPKNEKHGAFQKGTKVHRDIIYLHYWDGPDDWGESDDD